MKIIQRHIIILRLVLAVAARQLFYRKSSISDVLATAIFTRAEYAPK